MMPARRPIPLFDLVGRREGTTEPTAKPKIRVELKPMAAARPEPVAIGPAPMRLPINAVYVAISAMIVLLILVGAGMYSLGVRREAARAEKQLAGGFRDVPAISEPGAKAEKPPFVPPGKAPGQPSGGLILTVAGGGAAEPRESGLNYLALAVLSTDDTKSAMAFLKANGLETFGVPVDIKGVEANNRDPGAGMYRLYAAQGVTSDQYKMNQTVRTNLEAQAARLGQVWQKQHRGASNFAKSGWYKFQ